MLTRTPLDLTPFGVFFSTINWLFWLVVGISLFWALRGKRSRRTKLLRAGGVLGIVVGLAVLGALPGIKASQKLQDAKALFEQRCSSAGETIERRVADVGGIVWLRWRERSSNLSDQWKLDDPYGGDCGGEQCIANLLRITSGAHLLPQEAARHDKGYKFVETRDPRDHQIYRYTASIGVTHLRTPEQLLQARRNSGDETLGVEVYGFALDRHPIAAYSAAYGLVWNDISTPQDRSRWIAGGSLEVIDIATGNRLAKRVGFFMDPGQGNEAGGRSPWLFALQKACPPFSHDVGESRRGRTRYETLDFVSRVLEPRRN